MDKKKMTPEEKRHYIKKKEYELSILPKNSKELTEKIKTEDMELFRIFRGRINWEAVSKRKTLTNDFCEEFWPDMQDPYYNIVKIPPTYPVSKIRYIKDDIDWNDFVSKAVGPRFDLAFVQEFWKYLEKYESNILKKKNIPPETVAWLTEKSVEHMIQISSREDLTLKEIEIYKDSLDWHEVVSAASALCSIKALEKYAKYIDLYDFTTLHYYNSGIVNSSSTFNKVNSFLHLIHDDTLYIGYRRVTSSYFYHNSAVPQKRMDFLMSREFLDWVLNEGLEDQVNWYTIIGFNSSRFCTKLREDYTVHLQPDSFTYWFQDHWDELEESTKKIFREFVAMFKDKIIESYDKYFIVEQWYKNHNPFSMTGRYDPSLDIYKDYPYRYHCNIINWKFDKIPLDD